MIGVKVTVPKNLLNLDAFESSILKGLNDILNDTQIDVKATYATWDAEDKPTVTKETPHHTSDGITGAIKIEGEIWAIVNAGTPAHPITARNYPTLVFQRDYTSKTTVHTIGSKGGRSSGPWVRKVSVGHLGYEGRDFIGTIQKEHTPALTTLASDAVKEISK